MQTSTSQAQFDALWAKTARTTGATHPLLCHLIDVAEAAHALWLAAWSGDAVELPPIHLGPAPPCSTAC